MPALSTPLLSRAFPPAPDEELLVALSDGVHRLAKARPRLRHVTVEITSRCNLHCRHCYLGAGWQGGRRDLDFRELCALGWSIRRDFGRRISLAVTGGEPLVRRDIFLVLRFWRVLGFPVSLLTNATLLDEVAAIRLRPLVDGIGLSLDGLPRTHDRLRGRGAFRAALAGLREARRAGLSRITVKTAVHRGNVAELPALHGLLRRLRVRNWHVFPVEPHGRAATSPLPPLTARGREALCEWFDRAKADGDMFLCFEEQNSFLRRRPARETARLRRCNAGIRSLAVRANGDVVACVQAHGPPEGNVREDRLLDLWRRGFRRCRSADWRGCGFHRP